MKKYEKIRVRMDDGRTDTWEARKDQCDGCALEVGAFVVKKDGEAVGVYSLAHMISAVIE